MTYDIVKQMMGEYRKRSKQKGRAFELTYAEFKAIITSPCWYCGIDPETRTIRKQTRGVLTKGSTSFAAHGIDRIDPAEGYTAVNCRTCCAQCNYMKLDYSYQEFLEKARAIVKKHGAAD